MAWRAFCAKTNCFRADGNRAPLVKRVISPETLGYGVQYKVTVRCRVGKETHIHTHAHKLHVYSILLCRYYTHVPHMCVRNISFDRDYTRRRRRQTPCEAGVFGCRFARLADLANDVTPAHERRRSCAGAAARGWTNAAFVTTRFPWQYTATRRVACRTISRAKPTKTRSKRSSNEPDHRARPHPSQCIVRLFIVHVLSVRSCKLYGGRGIGILSSKMIISFEINDKFQFE